MIHLNNHRVLKKYIRQTRRALPSRKIKKQIMPQIYDSVCLYKKEHPEADLKMLQDHFGTPYEIAGSYLQELDQVVLLKKLRNSKRILATISTLMALLLFFWLGYLTSQLRTIYRHNTGYGIIVITDETF